ncbi:MAG TPA: hypothetical protein VFJ58_20970 [Armatimonadota bacterium]|nr:hypothetical protein [Armatimonadota bacterium]
MTPAEAQFGTGTDRRRANPGGGAESSLRKPPPALRIRRIVDMLLSRDGYHADKMMFTRAYSAFIAILLTAILWLPFQAAAGCAPAGAGRAAAMAGCTPMRGCAMPCCGGRSGTRRQIARSGGVSGCSPFSCRCRLSPSQANDCVSVCRQFGAGSLAGPAPVFRYFRSPSVERARRRAPPLLSSLYLLRAASLRSPPLSA